MAGKKWIAVVGGVVLVGVLLALLPRALAAVRPPQRSVITAEAFVDANGNGVWDREEEPLDTVWVEVKGPGLASGPHSTDYGEVWFEVEEAGEYWVQIVEAPEGYGLASIVCRVERRGEVLPCEGNARRGAATLDVGAGETPFVFFGFE